MDFNLADLFECVADHVADREALVGGDHRLTYRELDERSTCLAHGLAGLGVAAGDHVGLQLHDRVEHVEAMLACFKLRAVPVNVNWRYVGAELEYLFRDAGLHGIVYQGRFRAVVTEVARRVAALHLLVEVDDGSPEAGDHAHAHRYEDVLSLGSPVRDFGRRSGDDLYVLYTGGTTGAPKGVVWRQEDIFFAVLGGGNPGGSPIEQPEEIARTVTENRAHRLARYLPPGDPGPEQFVQLALGPLMHASGQWSALGTLVGGGRVVLYSHRHMDMGRVLDLVERERVASLNLVGDASARPLLEVLEARRGAWDTSSLRLLGSGGTMLSAEVKTRLFDLLPRLAAITEAVGSSEAPVQAVSVTTREGPVPASLQFGAREETVVLDEALRPVEPGSGQVGLLATRGRLPLGYHNDVARTQATFVDVGGVRWAMPGDMASVDADGSIRLLGRGATCINTGGEKVYPEEVEAVLAAHPQVADVVVVGADDDRFGQRVVAIVRPADPADPPGLDVLKEHCRPRLTGYKVPRALRIVPAIARSPAGKPDYRWARDVVAGEARPPRRSPREKR